jgi:hypothetical protein
MRVYGLTLKGLEFGRVDAACRAADQNAASLLALKHPSKIKLVAVADVIGQRRPVIIGFGAIRVNDHRPIALARINRNRATLLERVYPVVNILTMFFTWGVSHA